MLKATRKLTRTSFPEILRHGRSRHGKYLSLKTQISNHPAFSVVVSKQVIKRSTDRHRLKRRMYAIISDILKEGAVPYAGIFFIKGGAQQLSFAELNKEVRGLLVQAPRS